MSYTGSFLGDRFQNSSALSFALEGTRVVPEPGSLMLVGGGISGVVAVLRQGLGT